MNITESIRLSMENLKSNRLRAFLTMLGIIIGISAVITITTIGNSLQKTIAATMRNLGGTSQITAYVNAIIPEFETEEEAETWESPQLQEKEQLTYEILSEYKRQFSDRVTQVIATEEVVSGAVGLGKKGNANLQVTGVTPGYLDSQKITLISGRDISDRDNLERKAVAVVSDLFVTYACGGENPIGEQISIQAQDGTLFRFYVIGVYHYDTVRMGAFGGQTSKREVETQVMIPYTYAVELNKGNNVENSLMYFQISTVEDEDPAALAQDTQRYFNQLLYDATGNFEMTCSDMASELGQIDQVLNLLTAAIAVIAAISLIVGGVGVMNIMLVSVVERTREIGIRKALGARNKSILRQFLMEAVVICLLGGVIGILIGIFNGFVIAQIAAVFVAQYAQEFGGMLTISVSPSIPAIVISVAFSVLTGISFGYYPAKRAAKMAPIDALRYE